MSEEFERGVAEGIARERAAVVAFLERKRQEGLFVTGKTGIEHGDHHPEHAGALTRRDDRVRAEVLAGVLEAHREYMRDDYSEPFRDWLRAQDIPGADALQRTLAEAREAGRNEMRAEFEPTMQAWELRVRADERAKAALWGYDRGTVEVARREREAAAKAWDLAKKLFELARFNGWTHEHVVMNCEQRAAALRTPVEGGGES